MASVAASPYAFRSSTARAVLITPPPKKICRRILTPTKTASLYDESHDCSVVNTDHTVAKVASRFFFSMFCFAIPYGWGCDIQRGPTRYNGAASHCGECQAAHAAFSATLYDDKLPSLVKAIEQVRYDQFTHPDQQYLKKRFALSESHEAALSSLDPDVRIREMSWIISRLTAEERKGTFIETSVDYMRNATYENPTASNRIDCHLERRLRPLEERLAAECKKEKTLKQALQELYDAYSQELTELKGTLQEDARSMATLHKNWQALIVSQETLPLESEEKFADYLKRVQEYVSAYKGRFKERKKGAPELKEFQEALNAAQSYQVLKGLSADHLVDKQEFFQDHFSRGHLKVGESFQEDFKSAFAEIQKRQFEVDAQLSFVEKGFEEIHGLMKMYFAARDESGQFCTPTKEQAAQRLNDSLYTVTPSRSDLQKKTKSIRLRF